MTTRETTRRRLLVVDSVKYQKLFDAILGEDFDLVATEDPGEAILLATTENPDLILLSYVLENTDGVMVARELRESTSFLAPIILLLSGDQPTLRREAKKAGCSGFLIKPMDPDRLKHQIEDWLDGEADAAPTVA